MSDAIKIDTKNILDVVSTSQKSHILASLNNNTLYVPKTGGGVEVDPKFFSLATGDNNVHELELLKVNELSLTGRTDKSGSPTADSVYKVSLRAQIGEIQSDLRLHLCDALALMETGKAVFTFSIYENSGKKYLVSKAKERFSSAQIAEFFSK